MSNNTLQAVSTYNKANLALLQNSCAFLSLSNKKFKDFDKNIAMNLGSSVTFDTPPRFTTASGLVASFQSAEQLVETLTVDQSTNTSYDFTAQERIFNIDNPSAGDIKNYMNEFGASAVAEMGAEIESNIAEVAETSTFRFFGDGVTPINSYLQLANALAFFRNFGAAKKNTKGILSDLTYPGIVNSGLNQFTLDRNNKQANSWEVGSFSRSEWYESNLLPTHTAGTEGINGVTLTVVSVTKNADDGVTGITFSGATNGAFSVREHDKFQFADGVSGQTDLRFLTYIGHKQSQHPVQFRATADATAAAGNVTVAMDPPLKASGGKNQNVNVEIVAGQQVTVLPSHRCGLIMAGDPLYLGMPALPDERPFDTSVEVDPETGASLRMYSGSLFGQNQRGVVHDAIWGKKLVSPYAMMVALPL